MTEDERASRPIMDDLLNLRPRRTKPEQDKFEGFRPPDYLDRRWEPEQP